MKNNKNSGFTLIELLIVIAIIGVLAAVLIPNLLSARAKAADAAIKAELRAAQTTAYLYYQSNNNSYAGLCLPTSPAGPTSIYEIVLSAAQKNTPSVIGINNWQNFEYNDFEYNTGDGAVCHEDGISWAAIVSLKNPVTPSAGWCVDSTGVAKEATSLPQDDTVCPS